jgi:DNA-binding response OmpR family regulator
MSEQKHHKTILLIDDEIDLQQLLKIALKSRGYEVHTANNGLEGLAKLKSITPDLIILDLNMPKMGGLEFYQNICNSNNQPKYPVMVLTARANMVTLFKEFNIDGFMTKPFEIDELLMEVDTIIQKKYGIQKKITVAGEERAPRVCIVETDKELLKKIGTAFLNIGYLVSSAENGTEAIERIYGTLPDLALIKLSLEDLAGDIVILQLKRMAKTHNVKFILYTEHTAERTIITEKISQKEGIDCFVQYSNVQQLITIANDLLKVV